MEDLVWSEVKRVLQDPALLVVGIEALDDRESSGLTEEITKAERDLRGVQMEEGRAIRLYVLGKITEDQLDLQRKSSPSAWRASERRWTTTAHGRASGARKRELTEAVLAWDEGRGRGP